MEKYYLKLKIDYTPCENETLTGITTDTNLPGFTFITKNRLETLLGALIYKTLSDPEIKMTPLSIEIKFDEKVPEF
jgi:hypothetical protein